MNERVCDVLIVGGGVVGLSTALFLQRYGVQPVVVERHRGTSIHPRSRGINARVMECYRAIGIADRVREAGRATPIHLGLLKGETLAVALGGTLSGLLRHGAHALARRGVFEPSYTPEPACRITQDHLEPVLADAARERGATLRFHSEVVSVEQGPDGVDAVVRDRTTGATERVRARWLIAADGARSPLRTQLGIGTDGRGSLGHLLNVLFDADLERWVRGREFSLALIHHPQVRGLFAAIDNKRRWVFHIAYDRAKESPADYPPERCASLVAAALGTNQVPIRIESVLPWECAARVARTYRVGRVLLAGDSAHLMPPWGGMGANTGIVDGWDLAWKLAAVLGGADDALLDTYELERRPIGVVAAESSAANADEMGLMAELSLWKMLFRGPKKEKGAPTNLHRLAGFGWQYASPLVEESSRRSAFELDGRPGTRVPHVWLDEERKRSSIDLVGDRYALFLASGAPSIDAGRIDVVRPGRPFERRAKLATDGALLARPDGVVAWRGRAVDVDRALRLVPS